MGLADKVKRRKGVVAEFAQARFREAVEEVQRFVDGPIPYLRSNQPIRKMVLLELLDYLPTRQRQLTRWEHRINQNRLKE